MKIDLILTDLLRQIASANSTTLPPISTSILDNINKIRNICNASYSDQKFYGNAALNRKILLDKKIAALLTPETILAILQLHAQSTKIDKHNPIAVHRNSSGYISLAAILFYGFNEDFDFIKKLPTNDFYYDEKSYAQQQKHFADYTVNIINNILVAAKRLIDIDNDKYKSEKDKATIIETYKQVKDLINKVSNRPNLIRDILAVPGYTTKDILDQTQDGFLHLCKKLNSKYYLRDNRLTIIKPKSLERFIEDIIASNNILDGRISHLLFDRVHLEASFFIHLDIFIGSKSYKLGDIIYELIKTCENSKFKKTITHDQLLLRLNSVYTHLSKLEQIKTLYSQESLERIAKNYSNSFFEIQLRVNNYNKIINDALWNKKDITNILLMRNFLQSILDSYIKNNGDRSLYFCWQDAKSKDPSGAAIVESTLGIQFLITILSDNQAITLTQGPRQKNQATIALEKIVNLLLSNYKRINVKFNPLNELEIMIDEHHFNLTEILKSKPDYEQIILKDSQLQKYSVLVKKAMMEPHLDDTSDFPTPTDYNNNDKNHSCSHLHYGEKLALSIYTAPDNYQEIQDFLRNNAQSDQLKSYSNAKLTRLVPELIMHICVASHGLSKPVEESESRFFHNYRTEFSSTTDSFIQERIEAIKTNKPLETSSFTSASEKFVVIDDNNSKKNTFVIIDEAHSNFHLGKKIAAVSAFNDEAEVLYPPGTQFQNKMYSSYKDCYFFAVSPIRSIDNKDNNNYSAPMIAWHELEIINKLFEQHLNTNQHSAFRQHFDTVSINDKNSCVDSAKQVIRNVLDTLKHHDKLDVASLKQCKFVIKQAIEKNRALVKQARFHASLGKTHDVLAEALTRVNKSLKVMKPYINEVIENRRYNQAEYDKRYGLVLKKPS